MLVYSLSLSLSLATRMFSWVRHMDTNAMLILTTLLYFSVSLSLAESDGTTRDSEWKREEEEKKLMNFFSLRLAQFHTTNKYERES